MVARELKLLFESSNHERARCGAKRIPELMKEANDRIDHSLYESNGCEWTLDAPAGYRIQVFSTLSINENSLSNISFENSFPGITSMIIISENEMKNFGKSTNKIPPSLVNN